LVKTEDWFSSRKVQKAIAKTRPKYLARSPVSMRSAMKLMTATLLASERLSRTEVACYAGLD
jgi:hypothetical protein